MEVNGRLDEHYSDNTMEDIQLPHSSSPAIYDATFEDSIMRIVLEPGSNSSTLIQTDNSLPQRSIEPVPNTITLLDSSSISARLLNHLSEHPLSRPVSSSASLAMLASSFVIQHKIHSREQMQRVIAAETHIATQELEKRMQARRDATERNARIRREIEEVVAQREVERRMEKRALDEAVKRREKRQARREGNGENDKTPAIA